MFSKGWEDIAWGMNRCLGAIGELPKRLVWDREGAIRAGGGTPSEAFARPEAQTAQIQRPTTTSQVRQIPANPPFPKRPEQDSNLRPTP